MLKWDDLQLAAFFLSMNSTCMSFDTKDDESMTSSKSLLSTSAGVYPIFYYPLSIGTRGEGYRGHGTSRSVAGTTHPDPRHGTPPIREPKVKSRDSAMNAGEGARVIESQLKRHTPNTFRHLCKRAHTDIPTCACS